MDVASLPYKIGELVDGEWRAFRHGNRFARSIAPSGMDCLQIGAAEPFELLLDLGHRYLRPPLGILIVLHTPRTEAEGRYERNGLDWRETDEFLLRFRGLFERDARADLWVRSAADDAMLVYEKHDLVYAYGHNAEIESDLRARSFLQGEPEIPLPHTHHYHAEFDLDVAAMLGLYEWKRSPLRPGDGD